MKWSKADSNGLERFAVVARNVLIAFVVDLATGSKSILSFFVFFTYRRSVRDIFLFSILVWLQSGSVLLRNLGLNYFIGFYYYVIPMYLFHFSRFLSGLSSRSCHNFFTCTVFRWCINFVSFFFSSLRLFFRAMFCVPPFFGNRHALGQASLSRLILYFAPSSADAPVLCYTKSMSLISPVVNFAVGASGVLW